jgi:hypothetical protein
MGVSPAQLWQMGDDQVDLLLAYNEVASDVGPHGQFMSEATSPEAEPTNYETGKFRYVAHAKVDQAQRAILNKQKELTAAVEGVDLSDIVYVVEKVEYEGQ